MNAVQAAIRMTLQRVGARTAVTLQSRQSEGYIGKARRESWFKLSRTISAKARGGAASDMMTEDAVVTKKTAEKLGIDSR